MHQRSGAVARPVVSPAESFGDRWLRRTLAVSQQRESTWLIPKRPLRSLGCPLPTMVGHGWPTCGLSSRLSWTLLAARERNSATLRAAILSGIPTIAITSFFRCPLSGQDLPPRPHSRRPKRMPLAREDISHIFVLRVHHLRWAGCDSRLQSLDP